MDLHPYSGLLRAEHTWYVLLTSGGRLPSEDDRLWTRIASDTKTVITGDINGTSVPLNVYQASQAGTATIGISNSVLSPKFDYDKLVVVPVTFHVAISRKHLFGWKTNTYDFNVPLTLYPKKVAQLAVSFNTPSYGWVSIGDVLGPVITTQDKDGCRAKEECMDHPSTEVRVPNAGKPNPVEGDERITSAAEDCFSWCAFSNDNREDPRFHAQIVDNGTRATQTWGTWSHPATFRMRAHVVQWTRVGVATSTPVSTALLDGNPDIFNMPPSTILTLVKVKLYTGQDYILVFPQVDPSQRIEVKEQGTAETGQSLVVTSQPLTIPY